MPEGRQLRGRPHGPSDKTWFVSRAVLVGHVPSQFCCTLVQGEGVIFQPVFRKNDGCSTKGVCLDHIAARIKKLSMHSLDCIGPGDHQIFVAALQGFSTEIIGTEIQLLQGSPRGSVKHQHRSTWVVKSLEKAGGFGDGVVLDCLHQRDFDPTILRTVGSDVRGVKPSWVVREPLSRPIQSGLPSGRIPRLAPR